MLFVFAAVELVTLFIFRNVPIRDFTIANASPRVPFRVIGLSLILLGTADIFSKASR
jgi:hypothetical protein